MSSVLIIDGSYLFYGSKPHGHMDYAKLKSFLESEIGSALSEGYYLNSVPDPATDAQNAFHTWLKLAPPKGPKLRVQLYDLKDMHLGCPQCSHQFDKQVQKGVDVAIATLVLKLAIQNKYERLVLCAGDGDFEDAIKYVTSECGKELVLCGFGPSLSADLQSYARNVIFLEDHWDQIAR